MFEGDELSGEYGGDDVRAFGGKRIAMGGIDLFDEAMSAEHSQHAARASRAATGFLRGICGRVPEQFLEVAIAEAVEGEFAAVDGLKELGVFWGPRSQSADAFVIPSGGQADIAEHVAQRGGCVDRSEGVEVAVVGGLSDVGAAGKIRQSPAHGSPGLGALRIAFGGSKDFEVGGIVDGGFSAQDGALLVVEFDGVWTDAMFDADSLRTIFEVADDFAFKCPVNFAAEETHDVGAGEGGDAVENQGGIDPGQRGAVFEHDVGCPFALVERPIIAKGKVFEDLGMSGVQELGELVQGRNPGETHLLIHKGLGLGDVGELNKAVVSSTVGQTCMIHHSGEPFATVETDLNAEGQPALDARAHEAEDRINQVMIESQAFAKTGRQFQPMGIRVAVDIKTQARFNRGEHGNETFLDAVARRDLFGDGLLVCVAGRKILDGTPGFQCPAQGRFAQLMGQAMGVVAEVFQKNLPVPQKPFEAGLYKLWDAVSHDRRCGRNRSTPRSSCRHDLL